MQSAFIVKADELLDPSEYPESQQKLIGDLNKRINLCVCLKNNLLPDQVHPSLYLRNGNDELQVRSGERKGV